MVFDNKFKKILCQLGASYELAGRKLSDDTLMGAAQEIYEQFDVNEDEVEKLFRKARVISDIPTMRVLSEAYRILCRERPVRNALPPPNDDILPQSEIAKLIRAAGLAK